MLMQSTMAFCKQFSLDRKHFRRKNEIRRDFFECTVRVVAKIFDRMRDPQLNTKVGTS